MMTATTMITTKIISTNHDSVEHADTVRVARAYLSPPLPSDGGEAVLISRGQIAESLAPVPLVVLRSRIGSHPVDQHP